jgi:hypothetical protein
VFYLNVAYVYNCFQILFKRFSQVFHTFVSSVSSIFFCMLQLLHLDISKVNRVLHIECSWKAASSTDDVWGGATSRVTWAHCRCTPSWAQRARRSFAPCAGSVRTLAPESDVRALASPSPQLGLGAQYCGA